MSTNPKPTLYPEAQGFLDALAAQGGPQIYELSPTDARGVLSGAQAGPVEKLPVDIDDRTIPGGPDGAVSIRILKPEGAVGTLPAIVYAHGGGWVLGDKETHDRLVRELAVGANAAVVFVNYTPSPEAQYPIALEQVYATAKWLTTNGAEVGIDGSRLAIAGDSAGGCLAAATTLLAKERGEVQFAYQVLFYPVTDANFETSSYEQFESGFFLSREAMKWFWNQYAPDEATRAEPTASPLQASVEQLQGLPPTLVITGEADVLREEGEAYARKLTAAGVPTTALRYIGIIHDFVMLNVVTETPAARGAIAQAVVALKKALG